MCVSEGCVPGTLLGQSQERTDKSVGVPVCGAPSLVPRLCERKRKGLETRVGIVPVL